MKHTEKWFLNRIGKRIYRLTKTKCCNVCDEVYKNGLVVTDRQHAECLFMYQCGLDLEYSDNLK